MRLVIAVVEAQHVSKLQTAIAERGFSATLLGSSGGFLRRGNMTLFLAVSDERVDEVLSVLRSSVGGPTRTEHGSVFTNVFVVPLTGFHKF